jgi:hypothetical protein
MNDAGAGVDADAGAGAGVGVGVGASTPALWIVQHISSDLQWGDVGMQLSQKAGYTPDSTALKVTITLSDASSSTSATTSTTAVSKGAVPATINLRIPAWAVPARTTIMHNGKSLFPVGTLPKAGTFLAVHGSFAPGDTISATFGMEPRLERYDASRVVPKVCAQGCWWAHPLSNVPKNTQGGLNVGFIISLGPFF